MSNENPIVNQQALWDAQHAKRGVEFECGTSLKFTPNDAAVVFAERLPCSARILEIGSANGRDARYWASLGHSVIATDFSSTALEQLKAISCEQGVLDKITPVLWDVGGGGLPVEDSASIDAFYARSALHVDDCTMLKLADHLNRILVPDGLILIEGKGPNDKKIQRSYHVGNGTAVDHEEGGHLRRIWTAEFTKDMCHKFRWNILELKEVEEEWRGTSATFMRLIAQKSC